MNPIYRKPSHSTVKTGKRLPCILLTVLALAIPAGYLDAALPDTPSTMRQTAMQPDGLMVDLLRHPETTTLTNRKPRFSWRVRDEAKNTHQTAFRIIVSSSLEQCHEDIGDMWDSGIPEPGKAWKVEDQSTFVPYAGKPLEPDHPYYWKVRTWNGPDNRSPWSLPQAFRTGDLSTERPEDALPLVVTEVKPVEVVRTGPDSWFIDFGKAAFGTVQLELETTGNREIQVHLGEVRSSQYQIDRNPGGSRRYQVIPVQVRKGKHCYQVVIPPDERNTRDFAIHMPEDLFEVYPFRYCEIHGLDRSLSPESIRQLVVHYPFNDDAAHFISSSKVLNDVWELCKYSMKATSFCGYYVDGDRERIPYEADAYINQLGHYCVDREYAMGRRTHEHLINFPTWPTEWILDSVLIGWNDFVYTGDPSSLDFHYNNLKAKALMELAREDGLILLEGMNDAIMASIHFDGASLEMYPNGLRNIVDWPQSERDNFDDRPVNSVVNAFHYQAVSLMAEIAGTLGKQEDAATFLDRTNKIRSSFQKAFIDPESGLVLDGEGSRHSSLHANMFALAFGLVPEASRDTVLEYIRSKGMACSVYGSQFLMEALYAAGDADHALALLTSTGIRSWANMIYNAGSTISLEAWDDRFKPNQDWNHAWGAAPANIIPRHLMGVQPLKPGFEEILIKPQPGTLEWAELTTPTIRGAVTVRFNNRPGQTFNLQIETPANTVSRVLIPAGTSASNLVVVDGHELSGIREGAFIRVDGIGSGRHTLVYSY